MSDNKVKPPMHGPYARRAELLQTALGALLRAKYGKDNMTFTKRGSDQHLTFSWVLESRVKVQISKGANTADPSIWILRGDPLGRPAHSSDWKNEEVRRVYKGKYYDLDAVMAKIDAAVTYNKERAEEDSQNAKSMAKELGGLPVPGGTEISRDPTTGRYTIRATVAVENVDVAEARATLKKINQAWSAVHEPKNAVDKKAAATPVKS